jgi:DNA repair exonuclease SbcCD ATPase subunit
LEQELNESIISLEKLEKTYEMEINDLTKVQSALNVFMSEVNYLQTHIQQREEIWRHALSDMSQSLSQTRSKQASLNGENSKILRQMNHEIEIQAQETIYQAELGRYSDMLKHAKVRYETLQADLNEMIQTMQGFEKDHESSISNAGTMSSLVDALGPRGIQTFILQNAVYSLELLSQTYLDELSGGTLKLHFIFDSSERIARSAEILGPDGQWLPRPMSSLSGGQWRRCSLALSLGFADLVARRGRLRSSLLVLDEPLTHLDSSGRASVGQLLRKILGNTGFGGLAISTILIILQDLAAQELEESFDSIDEVTKIDGSSIVRIDQ